MAEKRKAFSVLVAAAVTVSLLLIIFIGVFVFRAIFPPKIKITISTGTSSKVYDGTALTDKYWNIDKGSLDEGHRISVSAERAQ